MNSQRESGTIISISNITNAGSLTEAKLLKKLETIKEDKISEETTCPICYDTLTDSNRSPQSTGCAHIFCQGCFKEYLNVRISSLQIINIPCPYSECQTVLSEKTIRQVLDKDAFENYQALMLKKVMNRNPDIKFCPKPGCSKQFKPSKKHQFAKCSCGTKICNVCCQTWHEGKTCLEAIDPVFEQFSKDQDIKFCMMCKSNVQRVQGCKHITCPVCDYEWCWDCGREFNSKHQSECPKTWSPAPPSVAMEPSFIFKLQKVWAESSKSKRIFIVGGLLLLSPIMLVILPFVWPLWLCFDPKKDLSRKRPCASFMTIIFSMIVGVVYAPFLLPFILIIAGTFFISLLVSFARSLYRKFKGLEQPQGSNDGRQSDEGPHTKRWVVGNTKSFTYTANSRPDLEAQARRVSGIQIVPNRQVVGTRTSLDNIPSLALDNA